MDKDYINYGLLIDDAMHVIVKKALEVAQNRALLGEHHFFISFSTHFVGVIISEKLRRKYPHEMTIVLQYQYEDLKVTEKDFSVVLSFDNVKERITIPFAALTAFADPSVKFGLQFRHLDADETYVREGHVDPYEDPKTASVTARPATTSPSELKVDAGSNVVPLDSFRKKKKPKKGE